MRSVTGIELGPDSCVLVRAAERDGITEVSALHVIEPEDWPETEATLVAHLTSIRAAHHLPRHARAVLWNFDNGSLVHRASVLRALKAGGFAIDGFLSPPQALARLARLRQPSNPDNAVAWLTLNRRGGAIAVVRRGTVLFTRILKWRTGTVSDRPGSNPELARYLIVAQAAQELRHAVEVARVEHQTAVETVVTCGDYPDVRSLTMPLIEELDVEVETLDSLEGIRLSGTADADLARERASALRLACAAATSAPRRVDPRRVLAATAAALGIGVVSLAGWWRWQEAPKPVVARAERPPVVAPPVGDARVDQVPSAPQPTTGTARSEPPPAAGTDVVAAVPPSAPLPVVSSILIGSDRRLAIVNGRIVGIGDRVGARVVAAIDRDSVLFRDASGVEVRVAIRRVRAM